MNRYCNEEWFRDFSFLSYSVQEDGLYCNTCVLFNTESLKPNQDKPNILVNKPYRNWKDAKSDLRVHSVTDAHVLATAKREAFIETFQKPEAHIDNILTQCTKEVVSRNRKFLTSIIKCIELCGRNGMALRGHRDDGTISDKSHQGNFKNLLDFRIDAGDTDLKEHMETCSKNASYISKTTQNELLDCIKEYIQDVIISEIGSQKIGPKFGIQADEVTDISNREQLGLVVRYLKDGKPIERLIEYIECESITGEALCEDIKNTLLKLNLRLEDTVSQTYDGAANFSGHIKGCATKFQNTVPHAEYYHCSNHDLNLALCHTCHSIPEIRNMLSCVTELGLFKFSPKRSKRLEVMIEDENKNRGSDRKINTTRVMVFCETRWIERHVILEEIQVLYEPILRTLEKITSDWGWGCKTVDTAYSLLKNITDSTFLVALSVCAYTLGFTKPLSTMLQGTSMDVIDAYKNIKLVKGHLNTLRKNCDKVFSDDVWNMCQTLARTAEIDIVPPRRCGRQTKRNNVPCTCTEEYFRLALFVPTIDHLISELEFRFSQIQIHAAQGMYLIPENLNTIQSEEKDNIFNAFKWALPSPLTFLQEVELWKTKWKVPGIYIPQTLKETLDTCDHRLFPNIYTCLHLLMIIPVSTAAVERSHAGLKIVKSKLQSRMGEGRLNALMLLYLHKDILVNYERIIDIYANRFPRRMRFSNPMQEK